MAISSRQAKNNVFSYFVQGIKNVELVQLVVYSLRPWKLPFPINEQSTNPTKVYNPPINPADRIQRFLPTRYNMGIDLSTPLVALTSA